MLVHNAIELTVLGFTRAQSWGVRKAQVVRSGVPSVRRQREALHPVR